MSAPAYDLPAVPSKMKGEAPESYFLLGGIERLTYDLRRGKAVPKQTVLEAQKLVQRVQALDEALNMRLTEQVMEEA